MRLGSILATEDMPSPDRLTHRFSIYPFLSIKPDNDNHSLLPGEGWKDILDPTRFVASIQWFLTNLFGIKRGPITFIYWVLTILHLRLESSTLA